jgi:hypothetical protein
MPHLRCQAERRLVTVRYSHYRRDTECHELLWEWGLIMTRCDVTGSQGQPPASVAFNCGGASRRQLALSFVEEQINDFLDGRTHGESVLHALYDHVLEEPIPARMQALFAK